MNRNMGLRYIPKLDGEWDNTKEYEHLIVVTHQGDSYTSKKRVPIGIDISNSEYWLRTGSFNAQLEHYRKDIIKYSEDLKNHKTLGIVNVKDYGAKGDGVADDTYAIKNCIDLAESGSVIYFPTGHYKISETITLNSKTLKLCGSVAHDNEGWGEKRFNGSVLEFIGNNENAFNINFYGCILENLIICNKGSYKTAICINKSLYPENDSVIWNLQFNNIVAHNFKGDVYKSTCNVFKTTFRNCYAHGGINGFYIIGGTSITFEQCWSMWCKNCGYKIEQLLYSSFINCACDHQAKHGYYMYTCEGITAISCGAEYMDSSAFYIDACKAIVIEGCTSYYCNNGNENSNISGVQGVNNNGLTIIGYNDRYPSNTPTYSINLTGNENTKIGCYCESAITIA